MFIQPNSTIMILNNVPLDTTYNHTLWFDNVSAQTVYFQSKAKYTLPAQSYQRKERGSMSIQVSADDIYDCNYLMFQNTSFGSKWFYAFITGVEYVNNANALVTFEIDPMQTYLFDVELKQCFVEREHSSTDVAGDNVIEEPVPTGDITIGDMVSLYTPDTFCGVIARTKPLTGTDSGGIYSGLFSGIDYEKYNMNNSADITEFKRVLQNLSDNAQTDNVVSVFMMPSEAYQGQNSRTPIEITGQGSVSGDIPKPTKLGNYTPRNKKLLTYPFSYMIMDTGRDSGVYRYEWFAGAGYTNWTVHAITVCNPQLIAIPRNYCGIQQNYAEAITFDGFPQIAYCIDGYRAYLAQTTAGATMRAVENVVNGTSNSVQATSGPKNFGDAMVRAFGHMGNTIEKSVDAVTRSIVNSIRDLFTGETGFQGFDTFRRTVDSAKHPNKASGVPSAEITTAMHIAGFTAKYMCVQENYARMIDDFFDMYGYATNRVKVPNRTIRPHWNFVKTSGCVVVGNAPSDDILTICKIYDNGITFWKNASEVGNYSLNNSLS